MCVLGLCSSQILCYIHINYIDMRKILNFFMMMALGVILTGCYDDTLLWDEMKDVKNRLTILENAAKQTNSDITCLQTLVEAMQRNVYVTSVQTTTDGYVINFSDGSTATVSNGKDGVNGTNAPIISVRLDVDGNYYWTLDDEWLTVDGERVRANGIDGEKGKDAIPPQIRINENTKEWEVSTDGGLTWISTGVVAEAKDSLNAETLFQSVDTSNSSYVLITLADGTELKLARYDESIPIFTIVDAPEVAQIEYGKTIQYSVTTERVEDFIINIPQGWKVSYASDVLTVTAPAKDMCHYDKEGTVAITVVSAAGKSAIVKLNVMAGEWVEVDDIRTLTFEDKDVRFSPMNLDYADNWDGREITKWSDLIDNPQYNGPLMYGNDQMDAMYFWYDEGNTELYHMFPDNYAYCFWGGGHAISNYWAAGYTDEDRNAHIARYYGQEYVDQWAGNPGADAALGWFLLQLMTPVAPHSGDNFCVHYGYKDFFSYIENLPEISFYDQQTRIIDHMYVTNTNYTLNQLYNGVKSEEGNNFGGNWTGLTEDAWLKIVANGYDSFDADPTCDDPTSTAEFYLVNGLDVVEDWQKWDLSVLGEVAKVRFNFLYSDEMGGRYGFTIPGYFAYDDIAVRFGTKQEFR